jgi:hypothetical protein
MLSCKGKRIAPIRLIGFMFFLGILLMTPACVATHTILDGLLFPAKDYYERLDNDPQAIAVCTQLEERGYQFDDFSVNIESIEVTYPDGHQELFPYSYSVSAIVVTEINRDFDNPEIFSEEEFERLQQEAQSFCEDYYREANDLRASLTLSGILFWDYVNGVRGGFWFSETCEVTGGYGWGTGSYASAYELDPSATCPSGRVSY